MNLAYAPARQPVFPSITCYVSDSELYDYEATGLNDYACAVLSTADRGWPGGLRWLHGELR